MEVTAKRMDRAARQSLPWRLRSSQMPNGQITRSTLIEFASVEDLIAARDKCPTKQAGLGQQPEDWAPIWSKFRKLMLRGDQSESRSEIANRIASGVARMTANVSSRPAWEYAPAGAYPVVPAAIGGDPFSMRSRTMTQDSTAPLRVFVPLNCSGAINADDYAAVLVDVLCAMLVMAERRPVELIGYGSLESKIDFNGDEAGGVFVTVPIPFTFLDYRTLALWTDNAIGRTVLMGMTACFGVGYEGHWPFYKRTSGYKGDADPTSAPMQAAWREHMDLTDEDVLIPPLFGKDGIEQVRKRMTDALERTGIELSW